MEGLVLGFLGHNRLIITSHTGSTVCIVISEFSSGDIFCLIVELFLISKFILYGFFIGRSIKLKPGALVFGACAGCAGSELDALVRTANSIVGPFRLIWLLSEIVLWLFLYAR